MPTYYFSDGRPCPYPTDFETANSVKSKRFDDDIKCLSCNSSSIKYTKTLKCPNCQRLKTQIVSDLIHDRITFDTAPKECIEAHDLIKNGEAVLHGEPCSTHGHIGIWSTKIPQCYYCGLAAAKRSVKKQSRKKAMDNQETHYMPVDPCLKCGKIALKNINNGRCTGCVKVKELSPRQEAIRKGDLWYMPGEPCNLCNTTSLRRVNNGACQGCAQLRHRSETPSPRQEAIRKNESWYMPDESCRHCGTTSLRRVNNGQCQGCHPPSQLNPQGETAAFMTNNRDIIMPKSIAHQLGFTVYRDGKYCREGHQGFRYVSTGNCIPCRVAYK